MHKLLSIGLSCCLFLSALPVWASHPLRQSYVPGQVLFQSEDTIGEDESFITGPGLHRWIGYTALLTGLAAVGTGAWTKYGSESERMTESHEMLTGITAALFLTNAGIGLYTHSDNVTWGEGTGYHTVLGSFAALGMVLVSFIPNKEDKWRHCAAGTTMGLTMLVMIPVLRF